MKTKKRSPLDYIFAVARIRALEKFLIKREVFTEAVESGLGEALRLFVEANLYGEEFLHIKDSQQLETILNRELLKVKELICNLLLDRELVNLVELDNLKDAQKVSQSYKSQFLEDYLRHLIDMHNIKTFLRLYILKEPIEKLKGILTCEGFIKINALLSLYGQDSSVLLNRLEYVHKHQSMVNYSFFLREAIQDVQQKNSFVSLERAINDFLIEALKPAKFLNFGPEPLLAYYFAKVNEINLMRMIILAKLNNVSVDLVKERLNGVYA